MPSLKMKSRARILWEVCFLLLAPLCFGARDDNASLKSLYDAHRWFELRDAVAKGVEKVVLAVASWIADTKTFDLL